MVVFKMNLLLIYFKTKDLTLFDLSYNTLKIYHNLYSRYFISFFKYLVVLFQDFLFYFFHLLI